MHMRLAQMYGCHTGTLASRAGMHARTGGLHGRTGAIVARRAATHDVTPALSGAHERMPRRTGSSLRRCGPNVDQKRRLSRHGESLFRLTGHLSLDSEDADHTFAQGTTVSASTKQSHGDVNSPSPHWFIPLGHRADAHGGRAHFAHETTRSSGHMRFLQNAVFAALKRVQLFLTSPIALLTGRAHRQ